MIVLPMGSAAVLVEDPPGGPAAWSLGVRAAVADGSLTGVVDVVPAAATVLICCASSDDLAVFRSRVADIVPSSGIGEGRVVTIPVRYDGADLDAVADAVGCDAAEVVGLHSGAVYEVAFCGFAPGFAYLRGLPDVLRLPRRATPRTRVPAGAVAIAAEYSAVYPSASPGGWHLLGSTDLVMFDPARRPAAVLQPGDTVRFEVT